MEKLIPVVERRFEHCGYPCVVLFMPQGHRCGYVGVPRTHPAYGAGYDKPDIECHGGLTYAESTLLTQDDENTWWFGFDCNHCTDSPDAAKVKEYFPEYYKHLEKCRYFYSCTGGTVKPEQFVIAQCINIANQLREMEIGVR